MLRCVACEYDNFPVTTASIYGFSSGHSLQMVSRCHQCGARIAEKCAVCQQLHPLGTAHCSLTGIKIQDFFNQKVSAKSRLEAFRDSDSYNEIVWWRRLSRWAFAGLYSMLVLVLIYSVLAYSLLIPAASSYSENLILGGVFLSVIMGVLLACIQMIFIEEHFNVKVSDLWRKMGNKERLFVWGNTVSLNDEAIISVLKESVAG